MIIRTLRRVPVQTFALLFAVVFLMPFSAYANYTSENFIFSYHYKPVTFSLLSTGGFSGTLENGTTFTQIPVLTEPSVRLHKFMIDDVHFYISDQGTFQASTDLIALSIYSYLATV
jgi:hypothetical protein